MSTLTLSHCSILEEYLATDALSVLMSESVKYSGFTMCTSIQLSYHITDWGKRMRRHSFQIRCLRLYRKQTVITSFVYHYVLPFLFCSSPVIFPIHSGKIFIYCTVFCLSCVRSIPFLLNLLLINIVSCTSLEWRIFHENSCRSRIALA